MFFCSQYRSNSPTRRMLFFAAGLFAFVVSITVAKASTPTEIKHVGSTATSDIAILNDFYTIVDNQVPPIAQDIEEGPEQGTELPVPQSISPLDVIPWNKLVNYVRTAGINLLRWTYHEQLSTRPEMKYDRKFHFGRWINDPKDETCYNTRARVLIRDSETTVSFKDNNRCVVERGRWADPYAGATVETSKDIQIDHMVPLKNAYISGAWEWNFQTRCTYANYMGNTFHLITASGHENMSKGDDTPERYLPPNQNYRCEYLKNWLKIKVIWNLRMGRGESQAILQAMKDNDCDARKFRMSGLELQNQRRMIYENRYSCPDR